MPHRGDERVPLGSVREILSARTGEEMALNERYLNPQMGRILRTLGFDRVWTGGEGAHLIDSDGERYLDLFGGYGVFAIGRNHPEAIAAIEQVIAAQTGNLPQLGVTLLSGVLAEQLLGARSGQRRCDGPGQHRHRGGRGGDQDRPRGHRPAARAVRRPRLPRAHAGLAVDQRERRVPRRASDRCCPVASRWTSAISTRSSASSRAATWRHSWSSRFRARASTSLPPTTCRGAQRLCRQAGALFVCDEVQTGIGRTGRFLALEHWELAAGHGLPRQGPLRRARPDRRAARLARGLRPRVRRHGAGGPPRVDVRRQRPRGGRRAGHAASARAREPGRARRAHGRAAARADRAAGGALRGRQARCAGWG